MEARSNYKVRVSARYPGKAHNNPDLLHGVLLPCVLHVRRRFLLRLDHVRIQVCNHGRDRRRRLVEARRDLGLLFVYLLQALVALVFRNLLQIFWTAVVQRNTNVCLFKRFNIVCIVTGNERDVPLQIECHKGGLLLRRWGAGEVSGVPHECLPE